jgi:hypothetical protein
MNSRQFKLIGLFVLILSCSKQLFAQNIIINNTSDKDRNEAIASISWQEIDAKFNSLHKGAFKIISKDGKTEFPYQLEYLGHSEIQNLLIQVSVKAKSKLVLNVVKGKPKNVEPKTFARYVPERLDDFAWENDKIAFRTYGKALEGTKGDAYGFDVWSKRTNELIIDRRYKHGDYHHDLGDGLDYYHVGLTLGAGNIAPILGDEIKYSKNYHRYKVLDNGPLRTSFVLEYDPWQVGELSVSSTKKISIDAGSQMNKVEVDFNYAGTESLPVVVGIIKRPENGEIKINEKEGITTYWEPQHGPDGTTGVAVILTTSVTSTSITKDQLLTQTKYEKGSTLTYYMGAVWDKAGDITNASQWNAYVENFINQVPLQVVID